MIIVFPVIVVSTMQLSNFILKNIAYFLFFNGQTLFAL